MIKAVILDIGGVVSSYRRDFDVDAEWERRLGLASASIAEKVWHHPVQAAATIGDATVEDLWTHVRHVLGLDVGAAAEFYEDCWSVSAVDPRVATWIAGLRPRYRVATLSNAWSDARRECVNRMRLDQMVDLMVFSAEEGVAKPDAEIYRRTLERLDVAPEASVFIDDRQENVEAAAALGMHALHSTDADHLLRAAPALLARLEGGNEG